MLIGRIWKRFHKLLNHKACIVERIGQQAEWPAVDWNFSTVGFPDLFDQLDTKIAFQNISLQTGETRVRDRENDSSVRPEYPEELLKDVFPIFEVV